VIAWTRGAGRATVSASCDLAGVSIPTGQQPSLLVQARFAPTPNQRKKNEYKRRFHTFVHGSFAATFHERLVRRAKELPYACTPSVAGMCASKRAPSSLR